jgi:hypothetical protein
MTEILANAPAPGSVRPLILTVITMEYRTVPVRRRAKTLVLAFTALGIVGLAVAGCTSNPSDGQPQTPETAPGTPGPNGTLNNGLMPEQWNETS